jgi:hypothetical protein
MPHKFPSSLFPRFFRFPEMLAVVALLAGGTVQAQEIQAQPRISIGSDFQFGMRLGVGGYTLLGDAVLSGFIDGELRPFTHPVRVEITPTLDHQYREIRYTIGPGFSIVQPLSDQFALNAGAGFGYTDGYYAGSNRAPASGWKPWAEAGAAYNLGTTGSLGTTLQLRPLPGVAPLRLLIQYTWRLR